MLLKTVDPEVNQDPKKPRINLGFARKMELMTLAGAMMKAQGVAEVTAAEWPYLMRMLNSARGDR